MQAIWHGSLSEANMQFEFVLVKELRSGQIKDTNKTYPIVVDQAGNFWRLFDNQQVELSKAYTFGYEFSDDKRFKNVRKIIPLSNIFQQKALKEVANRNDILRELGICTSYAIELVKTDKIKLDELFTWSDKLYDYITQKADKLMPTEGVK